MPISTALDMFTMIFTQASLLEHVTSLAFIYIYTELAIRKNGSSEFQFQQPIWEVNCFPGIMAWPSDYPPIFLLLFSVCFPLLLLFNRCLRRQITPSKRRLPPGPPGWPVFGNMFQVEDMPHRTLTDLRNKYGPVVWLQIGSINTMAILSAKAATVFFKNHDHTFADRTITETMRVHNYDKSSLALAPYGSYWRLMRRLVTVDMLVAKRINETAPVRRKCVNDMVSWLGKEARELKEGHGVHVARFVFPHDV
ncbi:hypothetical protein VNO77_17734 [Canavalia gladiata]|uniref:Cytochrome P450 n=1 Tax=Canavalia gladiata TaxID=3824 RepID=A0AAN9QJ03_CANGL